MNSLYKILLLTSIFLLPLKFINAQENKAPIQKYEFNLSNFEYKHRPKSIKLSFLKYYDWKNPFDVRHTLEKETLKNDSLYILENEKLNKGNIPWQNIEGLEIMLFDNQDRVVEIFYDKNLDGTPESRTQINPRNKKITKFEKLK